MPAPWARGARARILGTIHGQQTVNVLHFATNTVVSDGPALDTELLALAAAILECVVDVFIPIVSADWTIQQVQAQAIAPTLTDPIVSTAALSTNGVGPATNVGFAAMLCNLRTGGGGRSGRGKIFFPPCGDADITNGVISTDDVFDGLTEMLACLATKFGDAGTTNWKWGVLSRKIFANSPANFNTAFRVVTQATPSRTLACMRSRKIGHGQ